jgi:hypothetical protein
MADYGFNKYPSYKKFIFFLSADHPAANFSTFASV